MTTVVDRFWRMMMDSVGDTAYLKKPAIPQPPPPPPPAPRRYATRYGLEVAYGLHLSPVDFGDLSPKVVRMDIDVEPGAMDAFLTSLAAKSIDALLITPYDYLRAPRTAEQMAQELASFVARYRGRVWGYEIMNEANNGSGNGSARSFSPADYFEYLKTLSSVVLVHDARAHCISSGTSGMAPDWHRALVALGAKNYVDFAAFHPYGQSPSTIARSVAELASIWGDTPLICTEYGDADPQAALDMHRALDGLVDTSVYFSWKYTPPYNLVGSSSYQPMKSLFARP